jgi:dolichol-phosphate mannosyltransferase
MIQRQQPDVSVIVPTFREAENLPVLADRIDRALRAAQLRYEILVVDDASPDDTQRVCAQLKDRYPLQLVVRHQERGLSSAVLRGADLARGKWLVVMDADLSHPPERIPAMIDLLQSGSTEFVLGSRYVAGGSTATAWSWFRRWNSRVATLLARPLTSLSDPMAGFFAMPRWLFAAHRHAMNPLGYKIALEVLVKADPRRPSEIPIHFEDRQRGTSKMNWRQQLLYLRHLFRLYRHRYDEQLRPIRFLAVGAVGAVVDLATFSLLLTGAWHAGVARALAVALAMSCNYVGNERLTFLPPRPLAWRRYVSFCVSCLAGGAANWFVSLMVYHWTALGQRWPALSAAAGIAVGAWFNYQLCRAWVFQQPGPATRPEALPGSGDAAARHSVATSPAAPAVVEHRDRPAA